MPADNTARIAKLEAMLAASKGRTGYAERVAAIEAELERLKNGE